LAKQHTRGNRAPNATPGGPRPAKQSQPLRPLPEMDGAARHPWLHGSMFCSQVTDVSGPQFDQATEVELLRAIASDFETGRKRGAGVERSTGLARYFWDARRPRRAGTLKPHRLREYADAITSGTLELLRIFIKAEPGSGMISIEWRDRGPDHWAVLRSIGESVSRHDPADYIRAIQESARVIHDSHLYSEISSLGSSIQIRSDAVWHVEATVQVVNVAEIPSVRRAPTLSGPFKKVPRREMLEEYQDYVCSTVLKVACELFELLPIEVVFVHAMTDVLDRRTGTESQKTILSVAFTREGLSALTLSDLNAADIVANFDHRMTFSSTKGFGAIEPLAPRAFRHASRERSRFSPGRDSKRRDR
jgi:hypothetical protein